MNVEFESNQRYLIARISGQWTTLGAEDVLTQIKTELNKNSLTKVLMDMNELSEPDHFVTRFESGIKLAEILREFKAAGLSQPEKITGLGEVVAVNRGANYKNFTLEKEAIGWLLNS